jgi:hypothetical protein
MSLVIDRILKLVFFSSGGLRMSPLDRTSATVCPIEAATNDR